MKNKFSFQVDEKNNDKRLPSFGLEIYDFIICTWNIEC